MLVVKTIALVALLTQQAAASPAIVHGHGEIDSVSPSGTSHFSRRNQPINLGAAMHSAGSRLKALKPKHLAGVVGAIGLGGAGLGYNAHRMGGGTPQVTVGGHPDDGGGMRKRNVESAAVSEAAHALEKPVEHVAKSAAMTGKNFAATLGLTGLAGVGAGYGIHSVTHPKRDMDVEMIKRTVGEAQVVKSGMGGIKGLLGSLKGKSASEMLHGGRQALKNVPTKAKVAAAGAGGLGAGLLVGGHVGSKHGRQKERMQNGGGGGGGNGGGDTYGSNSYVKRDGACPQRRDLAHSGPAGSCMRGAKMVNRDLTDDDGVVGGDLSKRSNMPAAAYAKFPPGSGGDVHMLRREVGVDGGDDELVKRMKLPPMSKGAKLAAGGAAGGSALLIGGALGHGAGRRESIKKHEEKTKMENAAMSGGGNGGGGMYKRGLPTNAKVLVGLGVGGIGAASWAAGKHVGGLSGQADALKTRPGGMGGGGYYKRSIDDIDDNDNDMDKRALTTGAKALIGLGVGGVGAASFMAGKKTGSLTGEAGGLKSRPGGGMMYKRDDDLVRRSTLVNGLKGVGIATAVGGLGLAGYHAAKPMGRHSQDRKNARAAKAVPAAPMEMAGGGGGGGSQMMRRDAQHEKRSLVGAAALVGGGLAGYGITKAVVSDSRSRPAAPEPPMMMAY